jgi:CheY-like chemotaxis protein
VKLLIADGDAGLRSLAAELARERVDGTVVLEAAGGAEAIQLGLQRRPQIALLEVVMPRLGGIEAAVTLLGLRPELRLALWTAEPAAHRDRARELRLPLFDKVELDGAMDWLARQALVHAAA